MTEEERKREVERISRKTQKSVKTPSNEQRIIRIVRFKAGNDRKPCKLYRHSGRSNQKSKRNGMPVWTDRTY